jgi:hypothetical protein
LQHLTLWQTTHESPVGTAENSFRTTAMSFAPPDIFSILPGNPRSSSQVYLLLTAGILLYMKFRKIKKRDEKSQFNIGGG